MNGHSNTLSPQTLNPESDNVETAILREINKRRSRNLQRRMFSLLSFPLLYPSILVALFAAEASSSPYSYKTFGEVVRTMEAFVSNSPGLITLKTSQESFGLPTVGTCPSGSGGSPEPCKNYYMTLTSGGASDVSDANGDGLPETFFSGEVHGDEQVGPHAVLETVGLMLRAAECVERVRTGGENFDECWEYGEYEMYWLARLLSTRRHVVTPMSNALGFHEIKRSEWSVVWIWTRMGLFGNILCWSMVDFLHTAPRTNTPHTTHHTQHTTHNTTTQPHNHTTHNTQHTTHHTPHTTHHTQHTTHHTQPRTASIPTGTLLTTLHPHQPACKRSRGVTSTSSSVATSSR